MVSLHSGPERSRVACLWRALDGEDRCETVRTEGKGANFESLPYRAGGRSRGRGQRPWLGLRGIQNSPARGPGGGEANCTVADSAGFALAASVPPALRAGAPRR